jgi:hypothetical protein
MGLARFSGEMQRPGVTRSQSFNMFAGDPGDPVGRKLGLGKRDGDVEHLLVMPDQPAFELKLAHALPNHPLASDRGQLRGEAEGPMGITNIPQNYGLMHFPNIGFTMRPEMLFQHLGDVGAPLKSTVEDVVMEAILGELGGQGGTAAVNLPSRASNSAWVMTISHSLYPPLKSRAVGIVVAKGDSLGIEIY